LPLAVGPAMTMTGGFGSGLPTLTLDRCRASFETPASRFPQDDGFFCAILNLTSS